MSVRRFAIFALIVALGNLFMAFFVAEFGLLIGVGIATAIDMSAYVLLSFRTG